MASGLLSLKWNHHRSTFLHVLANIRQKESYCDVTLACDGKFYSAHKLVLSTCSEYFEGMFERTQCKHPVIVLKDIGSDELEALLSYMYDGEVNVLQENLSSLIKAAECLKIKGLAVADHDPTEQPKEKNSIKDSSRSHSSSNNNLHGDTSSNSSRQFRNSNSSTSGGLKRQNFSNKQEDSQPIKRRRPDQQQSSGNIVASSPVHRPVRSSSSDSKSAVSDARDLNPATPNKVDDDPQTDAPENSLDAASAGPSAVDDQVSSDVPDDARSFAQGLSDDTGVKAEPVEIIDSDDMGSYDHQADDRHDVSDAEFTEEKFSGGGANNDDPNSLWGNPGDAADLFSQPSTSTFSGGDGGDPNGGGSAAASGGSKAGGSAAPGPILFNHHNKNINSNNNLRVATSPVMSHHNQTYRIISSCSLNKEKKSVLISSDSKRLLADRTTNEESVPIVSISYPMNKLLNVNPPYAPIESVNKFPTSDGKIRVSSVEHSVIQQQLQQQQHNRTTTEQLLYQSQFVEGGRIYSCKLCSYQTRVQTNVQNHMRTHTNEKPFVCPHCVYKSNQHSNLKTHIKKKHSTDPDKRPYQPEDGMQFPQYI